MYLCIRQQEIHQTALEGPVFGERKTIVMAKVLQIWTIWMLLVIVYNHLIINDVSC